MTSATTPTTLLNGVTVAPGVSAKVSSPLRIRMAVNLRRERNNNSVISRRSRNEYLLLRSLIIGALWEENVPAPPPFFSVAFAIVRLGK